MSEIIYFVEDDATIFSLVKATLEFNGFKAIGFKDPLEFIHALKHEIPDLLVLDLMLPNMSGFDVITYMRGNDRYAKIPIIILSALSEETDIVKGLDYGASDYITKPFGVNEFISRIKANLRKNRKLGTEKEILQVRNLVVDKIRFACTLNDVAIPLTMKEFELLAILAANPSRVMRRSELLKSIWGFDTSVSTRTLDMHIKKLREKMAKITDEPYIVTVRSVGYVIYGDE